MIMVVDLCVLWDRCSALHNSDSFVIVSRRLLASDIHRYTYQVELTRDEAPSRTIHTRFQPGLQQS